MSYIQALSLADSEKKLFFYGSYYKHMEDNDVLGRGPYGP